MFYLVGSNLKHVMLYFCSMQVYATANVIQMIGLCVFPGLITLSTVEFFGVVQTCGKLEIDQECNRLI